MQKGYVFKSGDWWYVRYFDHWVEKGVLKKRLLAKKLTPVLPEHQRLKRPPEYVERLQEEFISKINQAVAQPEKNVFLDEFFQNVFVPHMAERRKISTCHAQKLIWNKQLAPRIGQLRVRDFSTVDAQQTLDSIHHQNPTLTRQTLFRCKSILSAVLRLAVNQGFRQGSFNPVSLAEVPLGQPSRVMPHYLLDEVKKMLAALPEPARTAIAVAAFSGLRRGEIEALRWEDIRSDGISVERSIWNGHTHEVKTAASKNLVPLIPALQVILEAHRLRLGNPSTGPLFPTACNTPVSLNNMLNRQILPTLRRCAHCRKPYNKPHVGHEFKRDESRPDWKGWHSFRRGVATSLHSFGIDDLTIQRILRHSSVEVTRRAYIHTLPEQSVAAMSLLEQQISSSIQ